MSESHLIPRDKFDIAAVHRALVLGYPAINPLLPELLEWVQDANWPVANEIALLLAKAGHEIVAPIQGILTGQDGVWKYWVIEIVIARLSDEVFQNLVQDLDRLATAPTGNDRLEEVHLAARAALDARARGGLQG